MPLFIEAIEYTKRLTLEDGTPVLKSQLKTGFLGFICDMVSAINIYQELVPHQMQYLLMYKFSQDHLETFFAAVRSFLGANNNPSCTQFNHIFKRFLVHQDIKSTTGNSLPQDTTGFLSMSSTILKSTKRPRSDINQEDDFPVLDLTSSILSEYKSNVITYIAGFVVKMMLCKISCDICKGALWSSSTSSYANLLQRKRYGHLVEASPDVVRVCEVSERLLNQTLSKGDDSLLQRNFALKIAVAAKQTLFSEKE